MLFYEMKFLLFYETRNFRIIALRLWNKLHMLGRYSLLALSIYKSKLNDFVFYNLKPVKIHVACITEQNVTKVITLDKDPKDKFNNKLRY